MKLKSKIKVRLAIKEKTQTWLSTELGVTLQTVNAWVNGRVIPPLKTAFLIARLLECKVDDLWELIE